MATELSQAHKDQLSKWIDSTKNHKFTLLYKISRDGCAAQTFHTNCDNKGPTVTVLYNTDKSVYGGYTAVSWHSNSFSDDANAFLFKLEYNGAAQPMKFPLKTGGTYAIYGLPDYGPTFGGGHDLHCFSGIVNKTGDHFPLNGYVTIGHTYNANEENINNVTNGHLKVIELKVYNVREKTLEEQREEDEQNRQLQPLEKPWIPNIDWSSKFEESMKKEVTTYKPLPGLDVPQARILLVGQVGAGKSSYFNSINSIFRERLSVQANAGSAEKSLTTSYRMYQVRDGYAGKPLNFRLCDNRGLEEDHGLNNTEVAYLLDGHVPEKYKFTRDIPLSPDAIGFVKNPTFSDQIHCVAFVVDASSVDVFSDKVREHFKTTQTQANQRGIPQAVLLTNIDRICPEVSDDVSKVFLSRAVEECVNKVALMMGLPQTQVMPVKNYHREVKLDQHINVLALLSIRRILDFVDDYLYNKLDEVEATKVEKIRITE